MRPSVQARPGRQPPAAGMEPPTGAPRHGWAVGGQRARSQPGRAALEVTEAVATQAPGSVRAAAARAGRGDRT